MKLRNYIKYKVHVHVLQSHFLSQSKDIFFNFLDRCQVFEGVPAGDYEIRSNLCMPGRMRLLSINFNKHHKNRQCDENKEDADLRGRSFKDENTKQKVVKFLHEDGIYR